MLVATTVDPRFKTKHLTNDETTIAKTELTALLTDGGNVNMENPGPSSSTRNNTTGTVFLDDDFWVSHDNTPANEDLCSYLSEPTLDITKDIFEYWASSRYSSLRSIALKFLSAPPTCICPKQSTASANQTDNQMSLQKIQKLQKLLIKIQRR